MTLARERRGDVRNKFGSYTEPADEVAVLRAASGERLPLNLAERTEVVRILTGRSLSAYQIAERMGMTRRTVQRLRAKTRRRAA